MATATEEREVTYLDAISQALDEEMERDERVFLMGEDIGPYGGAFRITEGFQKKYGDWRVLDTPSIDFCKAFARESFSSFCCNLKS